MQQRSDNTVRADKSDRAFVLTFLLMLVAAVSSPARGEGGPSQGKGPAGLPEIVEHSQTRFGVYRGDTLTLTVRLADSEGDLSIKWVKGGETFCRALTCEINTGEWSLGTHRATFVVYNAKGSRFLRYQIRILATPPGYKPGKVQPETVEATTVESMTQDDLTVRSVVGRGYSYHQRKLQVVGPTRRTLDWGEKLKTQPGSVLKIARTGIEEHVIPPRSTVHLQAAASGRRSLSLKKGSVRSRQMNGEDPRWSIVVGDWLQVDTDGAGDVIVTRVDKRPAAEEDDGEEQDGEEADKGSQDPTVYVTTLRGNARVYVRDGDGTVLEGKSVTVPSGTQVRIVRGDEGPRRLVQPRSKSVARIFKASTPQYLPGERPDLMSGDKGDAALLAGKLPKTFAAAAKKADKLLREGDALLALECLLAFPKESATSFEAQMLLGRAYMDLFLYKEAFGSFKKARKIKDEDPEPFFQTGLLYLADGKWKKAKRYFEEAEDLDYEPEGLLDYYLGVAEYQLDNDVAAKSRFTYALWDPYKPEVEESARAFRDKLDQSGWLDLRFLASAIYDSNVLRTGKPDELPEGIEESASAGYEGGFAFDLWAFRGPSGHFRFGFDLDKTGYSDKTLVTLEPLKQTLVLDFGLNFGGDDDKPKWVSLGLEAGATMYYVGKERAMDQIFGTVALGSPRLYGLSLKVQSGIALDPLPGRDDRMDPLLEELVPASERSRRRLAYGLGLRPVRSDSVHVDLDVFSAATVMRSPNQSAYDHKDMMVDLDFAWLMSLRSTLGVRVQYLTRDFSEPEDGRADMRTSAGIEWKWAFTTSLSQTLGAHIESQDSDRDANAYGRQVARYSLELGF